ncbi:Spy/CpxP family protein refolding chaperone [Emticicia sp. SJ17W-69]|uniref:Spy/CpxP family protein refolding chaperone n=1 Tax=Emticicia sp. SJ17W-69 TaxID=3421657 RepID=UPI003EBE26C9
MKEINKYRIFWVVIGLLLVLNIGLLAWFTFFAQNNPFQPKRLFLEKELQFDQKQSEVYKVLRQEHAQQMRALREDVKTMKTAYYQELALPNISDDSLRAKAVAIESKMVDADVLTFRHFQKVRQMCTPQQQKRFDEVVIDLIRSIERPGGGPPPRNARPPFDGPPPAGGMPPPPENMPPPN